MSERNLYKPRKGASLRREKISLKDDRKSLQKAGK